MASRQRQRGQVLVFGMLLAALLGLAWLRYFSTGHVVGAKARMVHGLDAAAYSGALVQARSLNFISYLNRSQLAHQLAMAHLLTMASWAHYGGTQAQRLARGNPPAHLIGMLFGAEHGRAYIAAAKATGLHLQARDGASLSQAHAAHESFVHDHVQALSSALSQGLPDARMAAIKAVLAVHYPERQPHEFQLRISEDTWPALMRRHAPDAPLFGLVRRIADAYPHMGPRNHTARNNWVVDPRCPAKRHELRRRGGTELDASGRWQAGDTQSFHAVRSNRWIGCYYREYVMGWAWMPPHARQAMSDEHVENPPEDFSGQDFWRWVQSATQWDLLGGKSNPLGNSYALRDRQSWSSRGLGSYLDVSGTADAEARADFVINLELADSSGHLLQARSSAESFFSRPVRRADGLHERPNLFHPYWHARLSGRLSPMRF